MIPHERELARCKWPDEGCGRRILWTTTEARERQRLDPRPVEQGSVAAYRLAARDDHGRPIWASRSLLGAEAHPPGPHEHRFDPHDETCPKRKAQRAAASAPAEIPGLLPGAAVLDLDAARRRRKTR